MKTLTCYIQDCDIFEEYLENWIYSSIMPRYLKFLIRKNTLIGYWISLDKSFNGDSQSRLLELHWQLQSLKKGSLPTNKYINKCKDLIDLLLVASKCLSDREQL